MGKIILVVGGSRSGKSGFAQELATNFNKVLYLATAQAGDEEMQERIQMHRKQRPWHWNTLEVPNNLAADLEKIDEKIELILIDCLTLYLNNFILERESDKQRCQQEWEAELNNILAVSQKIKPAIIFVSNEVGQGIVPINPLARFYRDLHGAMNQVVARAAQEVYKLEVGIPLKIK